MFANDGKRTSPICSPIWTAGTSATLYARLYAPTTSAPKSPETIALSTLREAKPVAFPIDIGRPNRTIARKVVIDRRDGASHEMRGTLAHIVARRTALRATFATTIDMPPAPSAASATDTTV